MKTKQGKTKDKKVAREQIMQSALASFRIKGITITEEKALATLKKVELTLEK